MDWGFTLIFAVLSVGIAIGMLIGRRHYKNDKTKEPQGILNVDYSDPEDGPYLFLELKVPIADVVSTKQVLFDVNVTHCISQK